MNDGSDAIYTGGMPLPPAHEPSRLAKLLGPWHRVLLDVIYPRACRVCDQALAADSPGASLEEWLCPSCHGELQRLEPPFCKVCGEAYDGAITGEFRCSNCADRKFAFEFAVAGFRAEGAVRELIHQFKYGRDLSLRAVLGLLLRQALEDPRLESEELAEWVLVPVPLHRTKEADRGFNQSRELCQQLARHTGIPTVDCLARVRDTGSQASLHRNERLKNLKKAFAMRRSLFRKSPDVKGAKVLLVDDVLTTGSTTHECARVLKRDGGVEKVVVITVARG